MKKNHYFLLLLIVASTTYMFGCKKTETATDPVAITNLDTSLINSLQLWLTDQKDHVGKNGKPMIDSLMSNSKWDQGEQSFISSVQSIVYIPVGNQTLGLAFFYNTQKRVVDSCFLVDVNSEKSNYSYKKMDVIQARYLQPDSKTNHGFTGQITDFTLDNKFKSELKYNNGLLAYNKTLRSKGATKRGNITTLQTCIAWYWVTTYGDGTELWQYMYTQCNDCEEQPYSIGITTAKTYIRKGNCVGGGATGPLTTDSECSYTKEEGLEILSTSSFEIGSGLEKNVINGFITNDPNSDIIRQPRLVKLEILKFVFSYLHATLSYDAIFTGIRFKNSTNVGEIWKWEQVQYDGIGTQDANPSLCLEVNVTAFPTPIVLNDNKDIGDIQIYAIGKAKLKCTDETPVWIEKSYSNFARLRVSAN
jgi:hypothetical protein